MKKSLLIATAIALVVPVSMMAQGFEFEVGGKAIVENKPKAFYYEINPYQPIGAILGTNRYILAEKPYHTQVEKAVGQSTFMADPYLLRKPVSLANFYNLDREQIPINTAPYQERGVGEWEIQILDARGSTFRTLTGRGSLPDAVSWDGRGENPNQVMEVGDVYSYIVILIMKDGSQMRKIGKPIDVAGLAYDNKVAIEESKMVSYDPVGSEEVGRYYQYVLNWFKKKGFSRIQIVASSNFIAGSARDYLGERLYHTEINTREVPEYTRVEFVFE